MEKGIIVLLLLNVISLCGQIWVIGYGIPLTINYIAVITNISAIIILSICINQGSST